MITRNNTKAQLELIWDVIFDLEETLPDCAEKDARFDEIKTVMGWIEEDLGVEEVYQV